MRHRTLGSTGERTSILGVGGLRLGLEGVDESLAIRIVREAVDAGIDLMDTGVAI